MLNSYPNEKGISSVITLNLLYKAVLRVQLSSNYVISAGFPDYIQSGSAGELIRYHAKTTFLPAFRFNV
jgi:hypothetical protein